MKISKRADTVLAVFVVVIAAMLLIPLNTNLLDFLIVINLAFSFLLLLAGLYMPNSMALLSFPTLLLLTTLFRLGLNVASSRLILLQGFAGDVIQSFGEFLIRGEVIVGIIIFLIITIVNFIVVAKGASRVAEVAARFTLDALPGKQQTIDSDLRAGFINLEQAQQQREKLRQESQLFGSMDGAMKFVQGDAIAGFFIILTNIFAGILLGLNKGLNFQDAVSRYTVLTIGDGLVTQIPALLISICAGIVVTRVSSADNSSLSLELGQQIFARYESLFFTGILIILGAFSGLPALPFISVGLVLIAVGLYIRNNKAELSPRSKKQLDAQVAVGDLCIALDSSVLYRLYSMNRDKYDLWWTDFRNDFYQQAGFHLPKVKIIDDPSLPHANYAVKLQQAKLFSERLPLDSILVEVSPLAADVLGLNIVETVAHPFTNSDVFWTPVTPQSRAIMQAGQINSFDFFQYISLRIAVFCRTHPEEIFGLSEVVQLLNEFQKSYLLEDLMNKRGLDMSRLTRIFIELIQQGISLRNMKAILESISMYYASRAEEEDFFSLEDIISFIRISRRRINTADLLSERNLVKAIVLSEDVSQYFEDLNDLTPESILKLKNGLAEMLSNHKSKGIGSLVVICSAELRQNVLKFMQNYFRGVDVVSYNELGSDFEKVATWQIA